MFPYLIALETTRSTLSEWMKYLPPLVASRKALKELELEALNKYPAVADVSLMVTPLRTNFVLLYVVGQCPWNFFLKFMWG